MNVNGSDMHEAGGMTRRVD